MRSTSTQYSFSTLGFSSPTRTQEKAVLLTATSINHHSVGVNRMQFLLESLSDLDASLRARGSRLLVLRGTPQDILPKVFKV